MNILLLGATGATGNELLPRMLAAGHHVTALVRDTSKLRSTDANLRIIKGDATDVKAMQAAMAGNDILVSVLDAMNASLITTSTRVIIESAKASGLRRVILLSSFAVRRNQLKISAKILTGTIMKNIIHDKQVGEELLQKSGLTWTIIYATTLINKGEGGDTIHIISENEKISLKDKISRADVAAWIVAEIHNKVFLDKGVVISRKES